MSYSNYNFNNISSDIISLINQNLDIKSNINLLNVCSNVNKPTKLQQRHKKKYAQGDMGDNSFVFTGKEGKLQLKANNLMMFMHLASGLDDETWMYHLQKHEYSKWFVDYIHDEELAKIAATAEENNDAAASRKMRLDYIDKNYTA